MKYFVHYPFPRTCNLRCYYCFLLKQLDNEHYEPNFTVDNWNTLRCTHLSDADEILFNFVGGETFLPKNIDYICDVLSTTTDERFEILTNGTCDIENYKKIIPFKDRCNKIGFTFHRKVIGDSPELVKRYEDNLRFLYSEGLPVYVKEMLFKSDIAAIVENKFKWLAEGVPVSIQDYKGVDHELCADNDYGVLDWALIDDEYKKTGKECACKADYKNLIIRGDEHAGDILACWFDKALIGNVLTNTLNPDYKVCLNSGKINVECTPKVYRESEKYDNSRKAA